MFRRPIIWGRPFMRRPRLLGAALVGGVGYALGRSSRQPAGQRMPQTSWTPAPRARGPEDHVGQLKTLADLHAAGSLTDEEFTAAKRKLLAE